MNAPSHVYLIVGCSELEGQTQIHRVLNVLGARAGQCGLIAMPGGGANDNCVEPLEDMLKLYEEAECVTVVLIAHADCPFMGSIYGYLQENVEELNQAAIDNDLRDYTLMTIVFRKDGSVVTDGNADIWIEELVMGHGGSADLRWICRVMIGLGFTQHEIDGAVSWLTSSDAPIMIRDGRILRVKDESRIPNRQAGKR